MTMARGVFRSTSPLPAGITASRAACAGTAPGKAPWNRKQWIERRLQEQQKDTQRNVDTQLGFG